MILFDSKLLPSRFLMILFDFKLILMTLFDSKLLLIRFSMILFDFKLT